MLSEADHKKIELAVQAAEAKTTGEIVCILAKEVSHYPDVPLAWAAAVALLAPPLAVWAGWRPDLLFGGGDWSAGTGTTFAPSLVQALETYAAGQALLFAALVLIFAIPPIRHFLTPSTLKSHRVHRAAVQQFLATGLHAAAERTGVVIFASQDDRRVELLADDAIHEAVGDTAWKAAVKAVQDAMKRGDPASGYVKAIDICGAAMAEHFPATGDKVNALSDRLLEL